MEPLPQGASLNDLQEYVRKMEVERGFTDRTITDQALKFGSEAGEVLDAVAAYNGQPQNGERDAADLGNEAADALIMLISVCNRAGIDLEAAFRRKEQLNETRSWH
ncbi:MazG nucleotide pyrophosphohydrolase domain-containing protein [Actinomadura rayongensis]|uniref:Pyrophosphohydrolase n=1 Tax=Actinomadura rayongensis TaxID=1429076 RepID=A0A6I4WBG0_9ACTN|nr:MazG nucleotide pyrophosphohydrolase domain-containing protein [Actinomadura rayongensis]MXQ67018.1 pyrophosphohydrolase [Actinomadura rayongensis]